MKKTKSIHKEAKSKVSSALSITSLPKYTEIKQMVEATVHKMLLEPQQETQSEDIIVFQNGVLDLTCVQGEDAFKGDSLAPVRHSHAVWSYFDARVWEKARQSGIGVMGEQERGDHSRAVVRFVAEESPVFYKFMSEWFPKDKMSIEIILRWLGYSMTTDTREAKFMFMFGPTRAGKGSIARLICGIVGSNNYAVSNYSAFEDKFQAIGMHDKLVVTMEEVEATRKEHERRLGMLKKYLGGERIVWEDKYQKSFEDAYVGKLIMQSNELLAYEDKGRSVTGRMLPVEFRESFFGSGGEAPDRLIFKAGEGNCIATLAALLWWRMRRNRIRGAFDFNKESWSVANCKACRRGGKSLLLESHKIAWDYLEYITEGEVDKVRYERCTREGLQELTDKLLEFYGKEAIPGRRLVQLLRETIRREFKGAKEVQWKVSSGISDKRTRGWKSLYINMEHLKSKIPEMFESKQE